MTREEICNKYIKVKATGILALHQRPKLDWAFKVVSGKESDICNGCFLEKYYPLRLPYTCATQQREDGKNVQFKEISKTMITRENAKELLPILQAFAEGKVIETFDDVMGWVETENPKFNLNPEFYRIKPKYRPFKTQEECWNEMMKHHPFGWVKAPDGKFFCIDMVHYEGIVYKYSTCRFDEYFEGNYTFVDGSPFGIKEE